MDSDKLLDDLGRINDAVKNIIEMVRADREQEHEQLRAMGVPATLGDELDHTNIK